MELVSSGAGFFALWIRRVAGRVKAPDRSVFDLTEQLVDARVP